MIRQPDNWEAETMGALYEAILGRMIITYMMNELVKTGIKKPMKTGVLDHLKARQTQYNNQIATLVREVDRQ